MTRYPHQTLDDLLRSGARLSPAKRLRLWLLLFEIEIEQQASLAAGAIEHHFDRLLIVAELIDPTRGSGPRLSWLLAFVLYGLASVTAVGMHILNDAQLVAGAFVLIGMMGAALALGAVLPARRERAGVAFLRKQ